MAEISLSQILERALIARQALLSVDHRSGLRLLAGFYEGEPHLVADLYGTTLLLTSYSEDHAESTDLFMQAQHFYLERLPWLTSVVQKQRLARDPVVKNGRVTWGEAPSVEVSENGVRYALDLVLNQDASFYLDTRLLRTWLKENSAGAEVLNTFAYTGSLGVAALAGGATRILQVDRSARFLELARRSAMLNHLDLGRMKLRAADVFSEIGRCKKEGRLFDLALLDPPFFSVTEKGKVDQNAESVRLINKIRPLVRDGGRLVTINNALFLSGVEYWHNLEAMCREDYLSIEQIIPVPEEITGFAGTVVGQPPTDPAPFNHSTKIVVLRVRRK